MAEAAHRGQLALDRQEYDVAIKEYTTALQSAPTSPQYLIQRATGFQRAKKYPEALTDANHAVVNAQKRGKREWIVEGQFRRACALYSLERYCDAQLLFGIVKKMDAKHKMVDMWIGKTTISLKELPEDDERRKCTVTETPDLNAPVHAGPPAQLPSTTNGASSKADALAMPPPPSPLSQQTPADKIRYDWYQNSQNVYFTLMVKGVPRDKAQVEITAHSLSISFPLTSGSSYDLTLEPLFAAVEPEKCISKVLPTKLEIVLVKAVQGQKWAALESSGPLPTAGTNTSSAAPTVDSMNASQTEMQDAIKRAVFTSSKPAGPVCPTSSKSGPKDWDKISRDLRKADSKKPDDDGKGSSRGGGDDDDDDDEGGDEADHFFKKLFKGASPDVQRAMLKSYQESNGTALSTNWEEVGKGKVETVPPDGMEAKKW